MSIRWFRYLGESISTDLFNILKSLGYEVIAPTKMGNNYVLRAVSSPDEIVTDFVRTTNTPKHFLYPNEVTLIRWFRSNGDVKVEAPLEVKKQAFMFIKPCDANAIRVLDTILLDEPPDPIYSSLRGNSLVIVHDCLRSDELCFCESVNARVPYVYDLWIVPTNGDVYIGVGSSKGQDIINKLKVEPITYQPKIRELGTNRIPKEMLRKLGELYESPKWREISEKCLLCGGCTSVCPSCTCFEVIDDVGTDLRSGSRVRIWTSCVLRSFTLVAGGRIIRKSRDERFKFRYYHKFVFSISRYGFYFCTGCGRCSAQCPVGMNVIEVIKDVCR